MRTILDPDGYNALSAIDQQTVDNLITAHGLTLNGVQCIAVDDEGVHFVAYVLDGEGLPTVAADGVSAETRRVSVTSPLPPALAQEVSA